MAPEDSSLVGEMARLEAENETARKSLLPKSILSVHVRNSNKSDTQEFPWKTLDLSARHCQLEHITNDIEWVSTPREDFPQHLPPATSEEDRARELRLDMLYTALYFHRTFCIALADHADDQVETSILHLMNGNSRYGALGARPVRRWRVGDASLNPRVGTSGIQRYLVQPFLEVSKDRILATCDANNLEYITDLKNYQPEASLRNYVRHVLENPSLLDSPKSETPKRPKNDPWKTFRQSLVTSHIEQSSGMPRNPYVSRRQEISKAIAQLTSSQKAHEVRSQKESLREAVRLLGLSVARIEAQVTYFLQTHLLKSPPGTALISNDSLDTLTDPMVRVALVRRLLRYVSPRLWGSAAAEARDDNDSFNEIVDHIFDRSGEPQLQRLCEGPQVLWTSVTMGADGKFESCSPSARGEVQLERMDQEDYVPLGETKSGRKGWLLTRQPPVVSPANQQDPTINALSADITKTLQRRFLNDCSTRQLVLTDSDHPTDFSSETSPRVRSSIRTRYHSYLWDSRVLVAFDFRKIPSHLVPILNPKGQGAKPALFNITIELDDKNYTLPRVVLRRPRQPAKVLARVDPRWTADEVVDNLEKEKSWIRFIFVRTWEDI